MKNYPEICWDPGFLDFIKCLGDPGAPDSARELTAVGNFLS